MNNKITITYRYSELDKQHEYGVDIPSDSKRAGKTNEVYIRWIWLGIGISCSIVRKSSDSERIILMQADIRQFGKGKLIAKYSMYQKKDAIAIGEQIGKAINKHVKKNKTHDKA